MIGWIALHALLRAFSAGANSALRFVNRRVNWERRGFVKWSALGLFGTWASLALGGVPAPAPKASAAGAAAPDAAKQLPQFAEYYTVTGGYPAISAKDYRLTVDGLVDRPFTLTLEELRALPSTLVVRNFQCVTGWVVPSVEWRGVRLAELAARAGVKREAAFITFYSADGQYTDSLSLVQAGKRDVLLAYEIDGQPLPQQQGYPVRLIVPEMYGYKSVKWVQRLSFVKSREMGYWEVRGYPADAYIGMQGPLI
jgi:DMSO/TMAO reductase YedYZ molybdopterin-dependent catalytic subunit